MTRKFTINAIIGAMLGATLATVGINVSAWQFWVVFALWTAHEINVGVV